MLKYDYAQLSSQNRAYKKKKRARNGGAFGALPQANTYHTKAWIDKTRIPSCLNNLERSKALDSEPSPSILTSFTSDSISSNFHQLN